MKTEKIVPCGYCRKPIHINDFGGIQKDIGFFHSKCRLEAEKKTLHKTDISGSFSTVISMVEDGWDISKALAKLCISRTTFYRHLTKEQKCLLDMAKTANTKYGIGGRYSFAKKNQS